MRSRGGARQRQLGPRDLEVGGALVDGALADEVLRHQLLVALVIGLRDRQLGLGLLHLGQRQLVIELHQQLAAPHALAIVEVQLRHAAADLGAQHHALARAQAADRLRFVGELDDFDPCHFHGRRTRGPGCRARLSTLGRCRCVLCPVCAGFVLVPPGRARGGCDADGGDHGVDCFRCHEG